MVDRSVMGRRRDLPLRKIGVRPSRAGRIEKGYYTDVVVFHVEQIKHNAARDDLFRLPAGIRIVLVNGPVALDEARCAGVCAGP